MVTLLQSRVCYLKSVEFCRLLLITHVSWWRALLFCSKGHYHLVVLSHHNCGAKTLGSQQMQNNATVVVCLKGEIKGRFHTAFFLKLGLLWWVLYCYAAQRMGESLTVKHSYRKLNGSISLWKWDNLLSQDFMPNVWHIISVKSVCLGRLGKTLITWLLLMCNPVGAISGVRTLWCYIVSSWVKLCLLWPWLMMNFKWLMVLLSCFWKTYVSGAKMQNFMVYKLLLIS